MNFFDRLERRIEATNSIVCIGLDPDQSRLPNSVLDHDLPRWAFNRQVIDATHEYAAAYKPNAAFYEDSDGWKALKETIAYAQGKNVPVIVDAKRADIGNTARQYANLLEDADAITVNPYMGRDSLQPFLSNRNSGVFILCRTSNSGGADIQEQELTDGRRVFELTADLAASWNNNDNVGLVVCATAPDELEMIRERVPDLPFLVPGVGAQGGDMKAAATYGPAHEVGLVNSTRGIIFAWEEYGEQAFPDAVASAARSLKQNLNQYR